MMTDARSMMESPEQASSLSAPAKDRGRRIIVIFRNDDPSACSDVLHERKIAEMFLRYGVPQTLGVIPFCTRGNFRDPKYSGVVPLDENPAMVEFILEYYPESGSEIALHGYSHRADARCRISRSEHYEFKGISIVAQTRMMEEGAALLASVLGIRPCTFIPPWNICNSDTITACLHSGMSAISAGAFTETGEGIVSLGANCDLYQLPRLLDNAKKGDRRVFLVVNYHSRTIRSLVDIEALEMAISMVSQDGECEAMTIRDAVRRYSDDIQCMNQAARNVMPDHDVTRSACARALVYSRMVRLVSARSELERLRSAGRALYWRGEYEVGINVYREVDLYARRRLLIWRVGMAVVGCTLAVLSETLRLRYDLGGQSIWWSIILGMVLAGGLISWWLHTADDTRRECCLATVTLCGGLSIGFGAMALYAGG